MRDRTIHPANLGLTTLDIEDLLDLVGAELIEDADEPDEDTAQ